MPFRRNPRTTRYVWAVAKPDSTLITAADRALAAYRTLLQAGVRYRLRVAEHFGVNWTEIQAINHLMMEPELSQTELAHRLGITSGASTALIDRLERAEMVRRAPHPGDRRRLRIELTELGVKLMDISRDGIVRAFDGKTEEQLDCLAADLEAMAASLLRESSHIGERPDEVALDKSASEEAS